MDHRQALGGRRRSAENDPAADTSGVALEADCPVTLNRHLNIVVQSPPIFALSPRGCVLTLIRNLTLFVLNSAAKRGVNTVLTPGP